MSLRTVLPIHIGAIAAAARAITGLGRLIRDNAYKYTGPAPTPGRNPYGEALQRALE